MLYDSIGGPTSALRWRTQSDWKQFELVREVPETEDLTLTVALSGLGEIRLDDVQIIPLNADGASESAEDKPGSPAAKGSRPGIADFLRKLQVFGGKTDSE